MVPENVKQQFELKGEILGVLPDESREINFLGRSLKITNEGIEMESDKKHVKMLLDEWDMSESRAVCSPGAADEKANLGEKQMEEELVAEVEATVYRRAAARLNYMSADRADISYAGKECSRGMARPTKGDVIRLKRVQDI